MMNIKGQQIIKLTVLLLLLFCLYFFVSYQYTNWAIGKLIKDVKSDNLVALQKKVDRHPRTIKPLIVALKSRWWYLGKDTRPYEAMHALKKIGEPAIKPLIAALKNKDIYDLVAYILARVKSPNTVELLIMALKDNNPYVRAGAATALGTGEGMSYLDLSDTIITGDFKAQRDRELKKFPRAVQPLIAVLNDEVPMVRASAVVSLGELGDPLAINPLIALLEDRDKKVQANTRGALAKLKYPIPVENLRSAVSHENGLIRTSAYFILSQRKEPGAAEVLISGFKYHYWTECGSNVPVCLSLEEALEKIGKPAVGPLVAALEGKIKYDVRGNSEEERKIIQAKLIRILGKISGQDFGEDLEKWRKWWEENEKQFK